MMTDAGHPDEKQQIADGFAVLAECWRHPTEELVEAVRAGALDEVLPEVQSISLSELRAEHARLFVGPGAPPCPPYESVYRDGDDAVGDVLGPSAKAVVDSYHSHDVALAPDWSDLPDHLATELEFVSLLVGNGDHEASEQFLDDHLREWFPEFALRVRKSDPPSFYRELLQATAVAIEEGASS